MTRLPIVTHTISAHPSLSRRWVSRDDARDQPGLFGRIAREYWSEQRIRDARETRRWRRLEAALDHWISEAFETPETGFRGSWSESGSIACTVAVLRVTGSYRQSIHNISGYLRVLSFYSLSSTSLTLFLFLLNPILFFTLPFTSDFFPHQLPFYLFSFFHTIQVSFRTIDSFLFHSLGRSLATLTPL